MDITKMNIYQKLSEIREKFSKAKLQKTGENKFAHFKYFELMDFLPQAMIMFKEYNVIDVFDMVEDKATLQIININNPNEKIDFNSPTASAITAQIKIPIQALGSQHTYLRRYLYMNALNISEHDGVDGLNNNDSGNDNPPPTQNNYNTNNEYNNVPPENNYNNNTPIQNAIQNSYTNNVKMASEKQTKAIYAISKSVNMTIDQAKNFMKLHTSKNSSKDLTSKEASLLIGKLNEMQDGN